jgi:hypothetical protein
MSEESLSGEALATCGTQSLCALTQPGRLQQAP